MSFKESDYEPRRKNTNTNTRSNVNRKKEDMMENVKEKKDDMMKKGREWAGRAEQKERDVMENVKEKKDDMVKKGREWAGRAEEKEHDMMDNLKEKKDEVMKNIREKKDDMIDNIKEKGREWFGRGEEKERDIDEDEDYQQSTRGKSWKTYYPYQRGTHVIAIGSDPNSERAFEWACRTLPRGDRLVLVHGLHRHDIDFTPDETDSSFALMAEKRSHNRRVAEGHDKLIEKYQGLCRRAGRECMFAAPKFHTTGELADKICTIAKDEGASDVICGSRGLGAIGRLLAGSTSTAVLHECDRSVIIVKEQQEDMIEQDDDSDRRGRGKSSDDDARARKDLARATAGFHHP